jgi:hypothetical protein
MKKTQPAQLNKIKRHLIDQNLFSRLTLSEHLNILSILHRYQKVDNGNDLLDIAKKTLYEGNILDFFTSKMRKCKEDDLRAFLDLIKVEDSAEALRQIKTKNTVYTQKVKDKIDAFLAKDNTSKIDKNSIEYKCWQFLNTIISNSTNQALAKESFKDCLFRLISGGTEEPNINDKLLEAIFPVLELALSTKIITYTDVKDSMPDILSQSCRASNNKSSTTDIANYLFCLLAVFLKLSTDTAGTIVNYESDKTRLLDSIIEERKDIIKTASLKEFIDQLIKKSNSEFYLEPDIKSLIEAYEQKDAVRFIAAILCNQSELTDFTKQFPQYAQDQTLVFCLSLKVAIMQDNEEIPIDNELINYIEYIQEETNDDLQKQHSIKINFSLLSTGALSFLYQISRLNHNNAEGTFNGINSFLSKIDDEILKKSIQQLFAPGIIQYCSVNPTKTNYLRALEYVNLKTNQEPLHSIFYFRDVALNAMFYLQHEKYKDLNSELKKINKDTLNNISKITDKTGIINQLNNIAAKVYLTYANKLLKDGDNNKTVDKLLEKANEFLSILQQDADPEIQLLKISIEQFQIQNQPDNSTSNSNSSQSEKNEEKPKITDEQPKISGFSVLRTEIDEAIEQKTKELICQIGKSDFETKSETNTDLQSWRLENHEYTSNDVYPTQIPNVYVTLSPETSAQLTNTHNRLEKAQSALMSGWVRSKNGEVGIKQVGSILELKIFGSNGQGNVRYFCDKCIVKANGKKLFVFGEPGSHKTTITGEIKYFEDEAILLQSENTKVFSNSKIQQKHEYSELLKFATKQEYRELQKEYMDLLQIEELQTMGEGQNETMKLVSDFQ